jgi:hypothetical protein
MWARSWPLLAAGALACSLTAQNRLPLDRVLAAMEERCGGTITFDIKANPARFVTESAPAMDATPLLRLP